MNTKKMDTKLFFNNIEINLIPTSSSCKIDEIVDTITKQTGLQPSEYYLTSNGKIIENTAILNSPTNLYVNLRLVGGKGGFGSMLRAIGAQIEKTTNREACRDLSGRRLRDINEEKRLKAWLDKQKERDSEAAERKRKKLEKLVSVPKHEFKDSQYENARSELTDKVSEAVEEGFKKAAAAKNSSKRKSEDTGNSSRKKAALWIDDLSSDSDCSSDSKNEKKLSKTVSEASNDSGAGPSTRNTNKIILVSENKSDCSSDSEDEKKLSKTVSEASNNSEAGPSTRNTNKIIVVSENKCESPLPQLRNSEDSNLITETKQDDNIKNTLTEM